MLKSCHSCTRQSKRRSSSLPAWSSCVVFALAFSTIVVEEVHSFVPHHTSLPSQRRITKPWVLSKFHQRTFDRAPYRIRNRLLTTKANGDDSNSRSWRDPFQKAGAKFKARPGTYLVIPVIAALVGWFTNWLAVQMIFYPIQFRGIPLYVREEIPLGLLGWQGIVPCKTRPMSEAMVHMVTSQLLSVKAAFAQLDPNELARLLAPEVPKLGEEVLHDILPKNWMLGIPKAIFFGLPGASQKALEHFNFKFLKGLSKEMIQNIDQYFDIQNCVQTQMLQDRTLLGELFKRCGQKELDFLTNSGLWFGFLLGLIQMAVALFFENPWTLSIGGLIVGLATNWLALKWIFEPVNPTKIGPFILQGQFLRRQKEVSAEFSQFFANKILTSAQVWNSILNDPTTSPSFYALFAKHFMGFANRITKCLRITVEPEVIQMATNRAMSKLPDHIPVLHSYIDRTMGLEGTLRVKMEQMTSSQFERVLHPIFEEDEATLIAAGAVLGFAAGLIQQGLETGKIKIPDFWSPVFKRLNPYLKKPRARAKTLISKAKAKTKRLRDRFNLSRFSLLGRNNSWNAPNGVGRSSDDGNTDPSSKDNGSHNGGTSTSNDILEGNKDNENDDISPDDSKR